MKIVGKIINGNVYIDRDFFKRFKREDLEIYGYTEIEIPDNCADFKIEDIGLDLFFNVEKYNSRVVKENIAKYEGDIVNSIRKKYSIDQELAILRQRDSKPEEFYEYNTYVEKCKAEIKAKYNL